MHSFASEGKIEELLVEVLTREKEPSKKDLREDEDDDNSDETGISEKKIDENNWRFFGNFLGIYFQDINQFPLLTREEEQSIGKRIEKAKTREEKEKARNELVVHNLRLVVSIAKGFHKRARFLKLEDLIGYGNIGLIIAAEKYNWRFGYKFSTYATWWIRQAVIGAITLHERLIRLPFHWVELISKILKFEKNSRQANVIFDADYLAEKLGISKKFAEMITEAMYRGEPVSLDCPPREEVDLTLYDLIPGENISFEDINFYREMIDLLIKEAKLTEKEKTVIISRFYLTLEEMGKRLGVSRERVRQIEAKAKIKLKNAARRLNISLRSI